MPWVNKERDRLKRRGRGYIDRSETLGEFLAKDGLLAETENAAIKKIIADQIKVAMDKQKLSKTEMAARMRQAGGSSTGCSIRTIRL